MTKYTIALSGNPNTGKSTIFNALTKLNQHTGNWAGKTVDISQGNYKYNGKKFNLVDLPGTYSLLTKSEEEEVARDYICSDKPCLTLVVVDATSLQRNLNLVLQILEIQNNVILVVNLLDEAKKKKIKLDLDLLSEKLKIPVIGTTARSKQGLEELKKEIYNQCENTNKETFTFKYDDDIESKIKEKEEKLEVKDPKKRRYIALKLILGEENAINKLKKLNYKIDSTCDKKDEEIEEKIVTKLAQVSRNLCKDVVIKQSVYVKRKERKIDAILTSKVFGIPIMIALLSLVFYITITGANVPSSMLASLFEYLENKLDIFFKYINCPTFLTSLIVTGFFRTLGWVISVMLPPMAIFFPMFAILEDWGYLPRIAFNLDNFFKKVGSTGKQSLTMAMGFGCNAAAIASSKIISSPKERIVAIVTNNFMPCNGRFPTIIMVSTLFLGGLFTSFSSISAALIVAIAIIFQFFVTALITKFLTSTSLKHLPSTLTLELPPYRTPQFFRLIIRSTIDKTLKVLYRAIKVAAPAGIIIWLLTNIYISNNSIYYYLINFLNPLGHLMGLDGNILLGFILGLPANEIVMPIIIMGYLKEGALLELDSINAIGQLFRANNWNIITAINVILFSLNHWPCGTTLLGIFKETNSKKWTILSFVIPTVVGFFLCVIVSQFYNLVTYLF